MISDRETNADSGSWQVERVFRLRHYIELKHEIGRRKPIQAITHITNRYGEKTSRHWFSEWDTFEEAVESIKKHHKVKTIINKQIEYAPFYFDSRPT